MPTVYYSPNSQNPVSFPLKQNINNGITNSNYGMPQKFNGADGGASFSMGRNIYLNTHKANETTQVSLTNAYAKRHSCSTCNKQQCGCMSGKSIPVQSSDQYIQRRKNQAIGRGTITGQNGGSTALSFKTTQTGNKHSTSANSALRRSRSGGSVTPRNIHGATACSHKYPYCR